ncbi:STAS domain-containing protein [Evansella sp. AB-P1]|uniref:STAS domain-containing protein n=1 Tax=Evansella sp. AB-P1 TaxID=3037653 RepID=UPI0024200168|nr:STAS domain-containing protein [Evansella sp. AB-P1]MDG5787936.1 STAS domain-containing protein [Evansella sp. AB-P1]
MNLNVNIQENNNETVVFLDGEVDVYTASILKEKLNPLAEGTNQSIVVDLAKVNYIDSTGLGVFIGVLKAVDKKGSNLKISGANPRVKRLFEITGLNEVMDVEEDQRKEV